MGEPTLLYVVAAAAVLWLILYFGRGLSAWLRLMRVRIGAGGLEVVERAGMPADSAAVIESATTRLTALGFEYEKTLRMLPAIVGDDREPIWADIYIHRACGSRATVQASEGPEPGFVAAVSFSTCYADKMVITENRRAHMMFPLPPDCQVADAQATTLADHWAFHCQRLAAGAEPPVTDWDVVHRRHRELLVTSRQYWQAIGFARRVGEEWRLTGKGARRYLRQVLAGMRRLATLPPAAEAEDLNVRVMADVRAWHIQESLQKAQAMSLRDKAIWFAISAVIGTMALGYLMSWQMVAIVLCVLLFHEFGHALAMRAVGYRNLGVLVLPLLGAVAIGRKDDAGPWQKLTVLLAGPVPGLLVAVVLLRLATGGGEHAGLLAMVGAIALILNLFNLLPFTPLDGGQILDTFLFARRPRLRLAFVSVSAVGLLAVAIALKAIVLGGVGLLLVLAIPAMRRRSQLSTKLGPVAKGEDPVAAIFRRLHESTKARPPRFAGRVQVVRLLLPDLRGRAPSVRESVAGMSAYLVAIVLPFALLWDTGLPQHQFAVAAQSSQSDYQPSTPPDWHEQLARAKTPEARWLVLWHAGKWYEDNEDYEAARQRYQEALAQTKGFAAAEDDLRVLDTRLALARLSGADYIAAYRQLLPALRRLPLPERWRLAEALETMGWVGGDGRPDERAAWLREAIAVREAQSPPEPHALLGDRLALARLIDAMGDRVGAERLLRRNLELLAGNDTLQPARYVDAMAWFLIAHGRGGEAEALISSQPAPSKNRELAMRQTLAWARMAQGKMESARQSLALEWSKREPGRWQNRLRVPVPLVLDLVLASADVPEGEARWLSQAAELKRAMATDFRGVSRSVCHEAASGSWESMRGRARLAVIKRLAGSAQMRDDEFCAAGS